MKSIKSIINSQPAIFVFCLVLFFTAAFFGWEKLHQGFNFLDEGWHMTEGWRLVSGDRLFEDKCREAIRLYNVFNALIFKLHPDITLLGFRKLQYILTICSLLIFSVALYKFDKQYWFQPLIFSSFAVTGLLPWGIIPNLNYYTYPHLFLVLHLSFLLLGLYQKNIMTKRLLLVASGLSIWGSSFCLLHTSIIILSPILLFIIYKKSNLKSFSFTFMDLCFVLIPFFLSWMVFVAIYREAYILSVISSIKFQLSTPQNIYLKSHVEFRRLLTIRCVAITLLYVVLSIFVLKKLRLYLSLVLLTILSISMLLVIEKLFVSESFEAIPMWFSSLFMSFLIVFCLKIIRGYFTAYYYSKYEELSIILLIPSTLLSFVMSLFSFTEALMVMLSSIPITAAISIYILDQTKLRREPYLIKGLGLMLFFLPFYYTITWYNINVPYYDLQPMYANVEIEEGFGKGIKTSQYHHDLYNWVRENTEKYTNKNDYIISYLDVPMVYMIAKRRPSFDNSWISFTFNYPDDLYEEDIEIMKKKDRCPKMAFIFKDMWEFPTFMFPEINPVSSYVTENMVPLGDFKINGQSIVRCFIDRKVAMSYP
jgi:hypothetical protein